MVLAPNEIKKEKVLEIEVENYVQLKDEYQKLLESIQEQSFSGCGISNAPFGTKNACGVTSGWVHGAASECIIPPGWLLKSGTTLCYGHGRCPNANFGKNPPNGGNIAYAFTIMKQTIFQ